MKNIYKQVSRIPVKHLQHMYTVEKHPTLQDLVGVLQSYCRYHNVDPVKFMKAILKSWKKSLSKTYIDVGGN